MAKQAEWELVSIETPDADEYTQYEITTHRLVVPGGWIYRVTEWSKNPVTQTTSLVFVPALAARG